MAEQRALVAAGSFYPASEVALSKSLENCFLGHLGPGKLPVAVPGREERGIIGLISPHAGYMYSGFVAAHAYYQLSKEAAPKTVIIIGPNHTGIGPPVSVYSTGEWVTPLGTVKINESLASKLISVSHILTADRSAHMREHSIEVQLPFLQFVLQGDFDFVPICMLDQTLETSVDLGKAISACFDDGPPLIIASTDFTHYECQEVAASQDKQALKAILQLGERALLTTVDQAGISMCGPGPVAAMLVAAKGLGARSAELLAYQTSGDVTGDTTAVVGYASVKVFA